MFNLKPTELNNKIFYLKDRYKPEESYDYTFEVFNHISKTGFTLDLTDVSPFVLGKSNSSTLSMEDKTEFYSGETHYISAYKEMTFIFNNTIQISGVNYQFYSSSTITDTKSCELDSNYIIAFNDNKGKIVKVNTSGQVLSGYTFCTNPIGNINIIPISSSRVIVGYFNYLDGLSYLQEISISNASILAYTPVMFYQGRATGLKINAIGDDFVITYQSSTQGIIQYVKLAVDHTFSLQYPFIFNNDFTYFSDSVYLNDSILVIYYDIDDQTKIRNCKIYDNYIGIGLPKILKSHYCYDLSVERLSSDYAYVSYYDGEDLVIYTALLKVDDDITINQSEVSVDDWSEGLFLTTMTNKKYMLSYMDSGYTGVYRFVDVSGTNMTDINCDYNLFNIDISHLNLTKNAGHNDYTIYYQNEIVEQGICYIDTYTFTYNI
jgi:hypothetical protein